MQLTDALQLMEDTKSKIAGIPGQGGKELKDKLDNVLKKNSGYNCNQMIAGVLMSVALPASSLKPWALDTLPCSSTVLPPVWT